MFLMVSEIVKVTKDGNLGAFWSTSKVIRLEFEGLIAPKTFNNSFFREAQVWSTSKADMVTRDCAKSSKIL